VEDSAGGDVFGVLKGKANFKIHVTKLADVSRDRLRKSIFSLRGPLAPESGSDASLEHVGKRVKKYLLWKSRTLISNLPAYQVVNACRHPVIRVQSKGCSTLPPRPRIGFYPP
jgi:hypothetical protein